MPTGESPYDPHQRTESDPNALRPAVTRPGPDEPVVPLMLRSFDGVSPRDPGSRRVSRWCWGAALVLIALITYSQQAAVSRKSAPPAPVPVPAPIETPVERAEGAALPAAAVPKKLPPLGDELDQVDLAARLAVKMAKAMPAQNRAQFSDLVDPKTQALPDAVRLVPAYAELSGREAALTMIDDLEDVALGTEAEEGDLAHLLVDDLAALRNLYTDGSAKLSAADRERITQRLGWQGRLAVTFDLPDSDPARKAMLRNGALILAFLVLVGLGFCLALVAGVGLFVTAIVLLSMGKLRGRLDRAAVGGSIGVEVLLIFLASFLGVQLAMEGVVELAKAGHLGSWAAGHAAEGLLPVRLAVQWVVLPIVVFYPRLRGFSRAGVKRALGWHRGSGFIKEMGCGILAYLACLPVYLLAIIVALVLSGIEAEIRKQVTGHEPTGASNPFAEIMATHGALVLVMMVLLATVWAPIVEETVFRGAMLRQLHSRIGLVLAALVSGTVFAMMHGYPPSFFPPLIVLGTGFALMRWWRGSLVSCVTAHALHNGTLTVVSITLFSLLG